MTRNDKAPAVSIKVDNVGKHFDMQNGDRRTVFNGLDIQIDEGSFTAILGPSGCGKSTLLRLIAGLDSPNSGEVILGADGQAPRVGLMLQGYPTLPWFTVRKNVALALKGKMSGEAGDAAVTKYLSRVGLFGWQDAYPRELSGGMLQRVALARTLAARPQIVLLDEPLGALDALTRQELQFLLRELHQEERSTFVMVTHDVNEALAVADRILILGPAAMGVIYDSSSSTEIPDKETLIALLRSTQIVFAAGTWRGYQPFASRLATTGAPVSIWMGLSEAQRIEAVKEGRARACFLPIQALIQYHQELADIDAVAVHIFTRPTEESVCERILLSPEAKERLGDRTPPFSREDRLKWGAVAGMETSLITRLDPSASTDGRVGHFGNRAECAEAVADSKVDACVLDVKFARSLLGPARLKQCKLAALPDSVWPDLWTVLIARRSVYSSPDGLFAGAMLALFGDRRTTEAAPGIQYLTLDESRASLKNGELDRLMARWRGHPLPVGF